MGGIFLPQTISEAAAEIADIPSLFEVQPQFGPIVSNFGGIQRVALCMSLRWNLQQK